jgi:hypothetical protein
MDYDDFIREERAYMEARDQVSDEELIARMNAAPDMGGALLVELSDFVSRRPPKERSRFTSTGKPWSAISRSRTFRT